MTDILGVHVQEKEDSTKTVDMNMDESIPSESSIKTKSDANDTEFLLADDADKDYQETDDESDDNELDIFLSLMIKAEKKNEKRIQQKKNQFGSTKTDWSKVRLDDVKIDEDTTDSEDEDDYGETTKFLSLMSKAKEKNSVVKLSYVQGKMQMTKIKNGYEGEIMYKAMKEKMSKRLDKTTDHEEDRKAPSADPSKGFVTITRVSGPSDSQDLVQRRKDEYRANMTGQAAKSLVTKGKRKFEERMTLAEASADDFNDSQDYVNFLQDKLQGIKIKLVK